MPQTAALAETLNPEQRRAVEHGTAGGLPATPLLVIAGAGLPTSAIPYAHRVAHLIVGDSGTTSSNTSNNGFTVTCIEMTKRVERIARKVMGDNAGVMTDALTWAGTYHGIGARLLREYAEQIGLDPALQFTTARAASADLMNLVRHEKGLSKTESRFPTKGTCLSIYSRCVEHRDADRTGRGRYGIRGARGGRRSSKNCSRPTSKPSRSTTSSNLSKTYLLLSGLRWSATRHTPMTHRSLDHVRVDEYQDTNRLQSSILLALKPGAMA